MKKDTTTFPLRLPKSIEEELVRTMKRDCTSINQFVAEAVAEKLSVRKTAEIFEECAKKAELHGSDRILKKDPPACIHIKLVNRPGKPKRFIYY